MTCHIDQTRFIGNVNVVWSTSRNNQVVATPRDLYCCILILPVCYSSGGKIYTFIFQNYVTTGNITSQNETMLIAIGMSKGSPIASYGASYAS